VIPGHQVHQATIRAFPARPISLLPDFQSVPYTSTYPKPLVTDLPPPTGFSVSTVGQLLTAEVAGRENGGMNPHHSHTQEQAVNHA
jgi:hypothetical protein